MPVFAPSFTVTQSEDGKSVLITDTSNWAVNDENYLKANFARNFVITDYAGATLATIPFVTDEITYATLTDIWINVTYNATWLSVVKTKLQSYGLDRIFYKKYQSVISRGCCNNSKNDLVLAKVVAFLLGATYAKPIVGGATDWQNNMDDANAFLKQIV